MKPIFIGRSEDGKPVELTAQDLETHLHGIGASRTGKSKLIEWITREFIRRGQGFCLIDPHGTLYHDLVTWLAYRKPRQKIVFFNPSYDQRIVGFNPFQARAGDVSTQADRRVKATIKAWGAADSDETPRLERWLRVLYHTLLERGYPLEVAQHLLSFREKQIRAYITQNIQSDLIRGQFEDLAQFTRYSDFLAQTESTLNRLFRFLAPQQVRRVTGLSTNNIDMEDIIENGKILLVNLQPSEVLTEENARLIGTLLLNELWEVGMRRKRPKSGKPLSSFYVFIDEFQKFLTPDISAMLDQAAKYGIHLLLFHQHLSQLAETDKQAYGAVMTNARTKIVFGGSNREDAQTMVEQIFPNQLDLKRIKFLIKQTKFRPVPGRDKVYTTSKGGGSQSGGGGGSGSGSAETTMWDPNIGASRSSSVQSSSIFDSYLDSTSDSWSETIADVPSISFEEFQEVTGITPFSLDELIREKADLLMDLYQRHYVIRRPGQPTITAMTPFVEQFKIKPDKVARYLEQCLAGFLTAKMVDDKLIEIHRQLQIDAGTKELTDFPEDPFE